MASPGVPTVVKWGKERFTGLFLVPGGSADEVKRQLFAITGVPCARQKVMCKGGWVGALKDGAVLDKDLAPRGKKTELTITLMGTAEAAVAAPTQPVAFAEDGLDPAVRAAREAEAIAAAEGMILPLQLAPADRDDGKAIRYRYNYFATGMPQRLIEAKLRSQRESSKGSRLVGDLAMTLGQELGKAMLTSMAVLAGGTLVTGLDNGRLQLWRHAARFREVLHDAGPAGMLGHGPGPVACMAALGSGFATGGSGTVKFWASDGECERTLVGPPGTTPRAGCLVAVGPRSVAVVFAQARAFDPNAFRLVPQNEEQRQRRAEAERAQAGQQHAFDHLARQIHVLGLDEAGALQAEVLEPWEQEQGARGAPPVTAMCGTAAGTAALVAGDAAGQLRLWSRGPTWSRVAMLQLRTAAASSQGEGGLSIVCVAPLRGAAHVLAVSTERSPSFPTDLAGQGNAAVLHVPASAARGGGSVVLVDTTARTVLACLAGHVDVVRHICALPNGDLVTSGGKHDATTKVWTRSQWDGGERERDLPPEQDAPEPEPEPALGAAVVSEAAQTLKEPGYVLGLAVVDDTKPGSELYALAGARYNSVHICL